MGENVNFSSVDASIKITTNSGGCSASFPCYETYKLVYMFGTNGTVFHNGDLQGNLPKAQTIELMKKTLGLYQNNICTPLFTSDATQNYELTIDQKLYKFGNDKGCMEMQDILNSIKTTIGV